MRTEQVDERDGRDGVVAAPFLAEVNPRVREHLAASVTLRTFLAQPGRLTLADRRLLVEQALVLLEQNYVHLPLKVAMHAVNPVQRLRLLQVRLQRQTVATMEPEHRFHAELSAIFHSVRDLHTNYLLPAPFAGKVAYLPFLVEDCYDDDRQRHYLVSHVVEGFTAPGFGPGAEVTHWSGVPIERAVELNADRFAGSNPAARHARGLDSLTVRPLVIHLPPYEEWVTVRYVGVDGTAHELRHEWLVVDNLPPLTGDTDELTTAAASLGLDLDSDEAGRAKALLFAPQAIGGGEAAQTAATTTPTAAGEDVPTRMPGVFRARAVPTASGTFGHVRIFTFNVADPDAFVAEFVRLVGLLPQAGLIVDVRDNGGGHIFASEFLLQTLTPRRITPEPVQFISMPLNREICRRHAGNPTGQLDLSAWLPSLDRALETGGTFSGAFPITPEDGANALGQHYHGPVVLITDARCYSATDIFAAGFQDHAIGPILGVDDNTGAGGANVWTHGLLRVLLDFPTPDDDSPYAPLPEGANMRVSIRRTLRVGREVAGSPVEDLGVTPDVRHHMTARDVLGGNADLLDAAGALLASLPVRRLTVDVTTRPGGSLRVEIDATGIERADVYVDDRPRDSVDVSAGSATLEVDRAAGARRVRVEGFADNALVASRTLSLAGGAAPAAPPVTGDGSHARRASVVYVHGAGNKPPADVLERDWDRDLFGRSMGAQTTMAYYADVLHDRPQAIAADACSQAEALALLAGSLDVASAADGDGVADVAALASTPRGKELARELATAMAVDDPRAALLPLPGPLRRLLLRELLRRLVPDAEAYFFTAKREAIRARVRRALDAAADPLIVVAHSLGSVIAYDVLREPRYADRDVRLFVTLGSPLGYTEIQDVVTRPLSVPAGVARWTNAADPLDPVALDTRLDNDFDGGGRLVDVAVDNRSPNSHAACGYLRTAAVRTAVGPLLRS